MPPPVSHDDFLTTFTQLVNTSKESKTGSIFLSMKRHVVPVPLTAEEKEAKKSQNKKRKRNTNSRKQTSLLKKQEDLAKGGTPVCLLHARLGKKKVATIVSFYFFIFLRQHFLMFMYMYGWYLFINSFFFLFICFC